MPGGGCWRLPRRGEAVARLPPSCVRACVRARGVRGCAKKILLLLLLYNCVPRRVSFSVSLCVSLAVSLICFAPFIYRRCGVSLAVSLPVPKFVPRRVSQFGSQFGTSSMSPRHISHPSLRNGWVTCAGSIPGPMCHGQRRRAAVSGGSIMASGGGSVRRENVLAVKRLRPTWSGGGQQLQTFHCGQRRRAASSGSGRFVGFIVANGVGRR